MPEPRASYSARRASNSASTAFLSASRIWASAPDGVGSSVTNRTASMARRRSARSLIPFPSLHLDTSVFRAGPRPPLDLDRHPAERGQLEAPRVCQVRRSGQEVLVAKLLGFRHEPRDLQLEEG